MATDGTTTGTRSVNLEVRDPIHGATRLDGAEVRVADHPWVQRLRNIRQMGFSQLAFPGATHSRYAHSIGTMHLAGLAFDQAYRDFPFARAGARAEFRACVRLAALCHDLGHPPLSHCTEFAFPALPTLGLTWIRPDERIATHEDYTVAILERTELGRVIDAHFPFGARHVAALVGGDVRPADDFFFDGGLDHRRLLRQLVSSELDVDRLDYLVRDATFSGARYGQVDVSWLLGNLTTWVADGQVNLALEGRAVYAFDHFLLARHHMFLMVYFHHKSVIYEEMLRRHVDHPDRPLQHPSDLDRYLRTDDVSLTTHLREVDDPWARRITNQQPYQRLLERHGTTRTTDTTRLSQRLEESGVDVIGVTSTGRVSRYRGPGRKRRDAGDIFVLERMTGRPVERVVPLSEASQVFERYAEERVIARLYVPPEEFARAEALLHTP
jgi:HD superfamily phosphohydrolase